MGLAVSGMAILLMLTGCSAQKKLNKAAVKVANNAKSTDVFFTEYQKSHELKKSDTQYLPGKETVKETVVIDTVNEIVTIPGQATRTIERHYKETFRVDTLKMDNPRTIALLQLSEDHGKSLETVLAGKDFEIINWKTSYQDMKSGRNKWRLWFFLLLGGVVAVVIGKYYFKFSMPFLK